MPIEQDEYTILYNLYMKLDAKINHIYELVDKTRISQSNEFNELLKLARAQIKKNKKIKSKKVIK